MFCPIMFITLIKSAKIHGVHTAMTEGTVFGSLDEYNYSTIALFVIIVSVLFLLLLCVCSPAISPIMALQEPLQPAPPGESENFHGETAEVQQTQDYV